MYPTNLCLIGIVLCFKNAPSVGFSEVDLYHEPDNELRDYILRASFAMNDNTVVSTFRAGNTSENENNFIDGDFNDIYIEFEGSEITLMNLRISGAPSPRLSRSVPNMMYGYLDTSLEWNTVMVDGKYEFYENSGSHQTNYASGDLRLIWINVKAEGRIAFKPIDDGDSFFSTNYDLSFMGDTFQIMIINGDKSQKTSEVLQAASKRIKNRLDNDVYWKLQYNLRGNVDRILRNRSIKQIFGNNVEMVKRYRALLQENEVAANNFVDNLVRKTRERLNETGFWELDITNISRKFSKNLEFLTVAGDISFSSSKAQNVSTIRRRNDFSLIKKETIELVGWMEFTNLTASLESYEAKVWTVSNSGEIVSIAIDGRMFIKFIVIEDEKSEVKYKPVGYELAVYIKDVPIEIRGLSFLLSWLHPLIQISAANHLKTNLATNIEENIKQVLDSIIYTYLGI